MTDSGDTFDPVPSAGDAAALESIRSTVLERSGSADGPDGSSDGTDEFAAVEQAAADAVESRPRKSGLRRFFEEWIMVLLVAGAVAVVVRMFVFSPFYIPSQSMEPTLRIDDKILINKLSYRLHDVNRGDVVVFERPPTLRDPSIKDLVKRVIGLPGDRVEIRNGSVWINDQRMEEPYVAGPTDSSFQGADDPEANPDPDGDGVAIVPEGMVFVMGDNRPGSNSYDSRFWGFLDQDLIEGRAFVIYWPRGHWKWL